MRFDPSVERRGRMILEPAEAPEEEQELAWQDLREAGTVSGIRALIIAGTALGRPFARFIVFFVALYYTLTSRVARRAVEEIRTSLGLPNTFSDTFRHIRRFAQVALDALFFLQGELRHFQITRTGKENLATLKATGQSAVLLGGHVGSFYAMRAMSRDEGLALSPVVYTKNARIINSLLERLDPASTTRLVEIGDGGQVDFMLAIRERAEAGGLIAILADRVGQDARFVEVDFLGRKARIPQGPFLVAASLRLPVYFTAGLYRGGNRYDLYCRPFAERIVLPRGGREAALQRYAQAYADELAGIVRDQPDNWFNYFDFFVEGDEQNPTTTEQ